ncbi:Gfo/Idh/MocA family oxidoreductase [Planktomarina temperata]|nr:Gfo/Idh/MocA family oxidoreductase [Planktomarina temperata]
MTLRYGLIGCGMMGQEHIRNIELLDDTQITVVFEPDAQMRAQAAKALPNATMVDSLDALLAFEALDCLVIVSPNHCHMAQLQQIAALRALPILCEKPLFTDPADLAQATAFAQSYPAPVWVAMEYRYMPPVAAMIEQAEEVTGGIKMLTIREHRFPFLPKVGDWNRFNHNSGGTLVEKCCHFFDLMRLILKSDPIRVMASAGQEVNHLDEVYAGHRSDIWDCGYVIVDFASGARAMLELSMFAEGSEYQEEIHAVGPKGKIACNVPGPARFWPTHMPSPPVPHVVISPRSPMGPRRIDTPVPKALLAAGDHNGSTFYQHQKFQQVVLQGAAPEVSLTDGIWAVRMGQAAQVSALKNRVVEL